MAALRRYFLNRGGRQTHATMWVKFGEKKTVDLAVPLAIFEGSAALSWATRIGPLSETNPIDVGDCAIFERALEATSLRQTLDLTIDEFLELAEHCHVRFFNMAWLSIRCATAPAPYEKLMLENLSNDVLAEFDALPRVDAATMNYVMQQYPGFNHELFHPLDVLEHSSLSSLENLRDCLNFAVSLENRAVENHVIDMPVITKHRQLKNTTIAERLSWFTHGLSNHIFHDRGSDLAPFYVTGSAMAFLLTQNITMYADSDINIIVDTDDAKVFDKTVDWITQYYRELIREQIMDEHYDEERHGGDLLVEIQTSTDLHRKFQSSLWNCSQLDIFSGEPRSTIAKFHLSCVRAFWDGETLHCLPTYLQTALDKRCRHVRFGVGPLPNDHETQVKICKKYIDRGFKIDMDRALHIDVLLARLEERFASDDREIVNELRGLIKD